jgi:hypothetical protein
VGEGGRSGGSGWEVGEGGRSGLLLRRYVVVGGEEEDKGGMEGDRIDGVGGEGVNDGV